MPLAWLLGDAPPKVLDYNQIAAQLDSQRRAAETANSESLKDALSALDANARKPKRYTYAHIRPSMHHPLTFGPGWINALNNMRGLEVI